MGFLSLPDRWRDEDDAEDRPVSALEDAALAYAQQGLNVFPLQPNGKTPLTAHGLDDATTDAMTIETWWERWPNANIAIRTGDVLVVDEDKLGAFTDYAAEEHKLIPTTRIVKTSNGRHFYFFQNETRVRNTAGKLAQGIDTRGDGGYVVAPPSVHPSGSVYEVDADEPIALAPDWLGEVLVKRQPERMPMPDIPLFGTTAYGRRALEQEIDAVAHAVEGTRNDRLNTAAFALGQLVAGGEVDAHDAFNSLEAAAQSAGLPQIEANKTIQSGFIAGQAEPRSAPEDGRTMMSRHGVMLKVLPAPQSDPLTEMEAERDSWVPINLNDLPETPPVKPDLGATHLIYPGKRHVFSGPPESAKTLAAYCILIQIARRGRLGLLIDFEMGGYDSRKRLQELGATREEIDRILYIEPEQPANPQRIMPLVDLNPELVVIDASAGVFSLEGLDDNKRLDVERVATLYIKQFWRNQIATILIDHVVKDSESRGRYAIGSERKLGGADVHLGFDVVTPISRGTAGKYKMTTHKDRGGFLKRGYLADLNLSSDPVTHNIAWSVSEAVMTTNEKGEKRPDIKMEQISNKLSGREERLTVNEVKELVGGSGKHAGEAIAVLIEEGHLDAQPGPRGSKLLLLTRPYNRAEDPLLHPDSEGRDSPILVWFSSDSGTGDQVTDSLVPGLTSPEPVKSLSHPPENQPEEAHRFPGWFDTEGNLDERAGEHLDPDLDWT